MDDITGEKLSSIQVAIHPRFNRSGHLSRRMGGDEVKEGNWEIVNLARYRV